MKVRNSVDSFVSAELHPDGNTMVVATDDLQEVFTIWDVEEMHQLATLVESSSPVISYNDTGDTIAGLGKNENLLLWNSMTGDILNSVDVSGSEIEFFGSTIVGIVSNSGRQTAIIQVWDVELEKLLGEWILETDSTVRDIEFTPSGNEIAVATADGKINIIDRSTGRIRTLNSQEVFTDDRGFGLGLHDISYSRAGDFFVAGGHSGVVTLWTVNDENSYGHLGSFSAGLPVYTAEIHPAYNWIVTGAEDELRFWIFSNFYQSIEMIGCINIGSNSAIIGSISFNETGSRMAVSYGEGVRVFQFRNVDG